MALGRDRMVLVVDDDDGMREAIESLLEVAGYATVTFASAEALLTEARSEHVLCIISDLKLPVMSGLELLTALRARGNQAPVILITAHDSAGVRSEAERLGVAAFLAKPFAASSLLGAIERVAGAATAG